MPRSFQEPDFAGSGGMRLALPTPTRVVKQLLIANFAIYFGLFFLDWALPGAELWAGEWFGLSPGLWRENFPFVPVWQVLTYGFLHGSPGHVFWNMLQLYFFGTMLEGIIGSRRFLAFYLASVMVGGLAQVLASTLSGDLIPAVGASGGVLGVVVAAAVLQPNALVFLLFIPITLKWLAIGVVGIDLFNLLSSLKAGRPDGIAHWAHLGGATLGFLAARRRWIWIDPVERLEARRSAAQEDRRRTDAERMDQLLDKIHREGMGSLTRREREFLKRVSSRR